MDSAVQIHRFILRTLISLPFDARAAVHPALAGHRTALRDKLKGGFQIMFLSSTVRRSVFRPVAAFLASAAPLRTALHERTARFASARSDDVGWTPSQVQKMSARRTAA